jgi:hypothetical protein
MANGSFAVLKKESLFYSLFPEGRVPIFPLGAEGVVYMMDVTRCTPDQITAVAEAVAKTLGGTPDEVKDFLMTDRRMPIRMSQVERVEDLGVDMRMMV